VSVPSAISIRALSVTYPATRRQEARQAVRPLDLDIAAGQFVALLGPNGSGKSSLIRAICGMVPFGGRLEVFGETQSDVIRRSIGVVLQSPSLDPQLTVRENLRDLAALYGIPARDLTSRIDRALHDAALDEHADTLVKRLSGGLKRRVDLVRALLHDPDILLLDEPTVGLDPPSRMAFIDSLVRRREQRELTILISTHLTDEAERCDRVLFMHGGALAADDPPGTLRARLGRRRLTVHASEPPRAEIGQSWHRAADGWTATLESDTQDVAALAQALTESGAAFTIAPPTLADAFVALTGTSLREHADA